MIHQRASLKPPFDTTTKTTLQPSGGGRQKGKGNSEERKFFPLSIRARQNITSEIFSELSNAGFAVDEDNESVPENIHVAITVDSVADTAIERNAIAV